MATIDDIAKTCELSSETVARALTGAPDISFENRDRVQRAAEMLGYFTDSKAATENRTRSWTICVLCHDKSEWGVHHYLFSSIIESFRSVVERRGYDIVLLSD
ncbi:MAG: LacI family DNA-binding transcriptional regulator, partial [Eubacteriales bacterium]